MKLYLVQKIVQIPVGVSASPIDIARAYMAGRTSEGGQDLYNPTSKRERAQTSYEFARKPLLPSASPKPSICWPGSMAHERHSYATPQSQRTRHSLHDFPRTPYSRTVLSKSTTKENIGGVASHKSKFLPNFHEKSMDEAKDAVNENSKASSSFFAGSSIAPGAKATSIFGLKGTTGLVENKSNETSTNMNFFRSQTINGQDSKIVAGTTSQDFPKSHGNNKPLLKSISVNKAFLQSVPSENGPSFTFPVSASAGGGFAEPPTPSITPSSSQPIGGAGPTVPSYTFATEKSTPRLVFSFPSTSNASAQNDGSDIKFNFGSDKKTRLSFSSFGKDEICY
ncbi:hypothetical protein MIMGU_mgv1a009613mg [Erythranthe guttata]|uniref:Uncharacterized protein n=1 Tax=Erythranthe guttata TaxID=4155 RepID=A0A022R457_ERYGU|nr:hypothetical protein MIMGU_mgv1a009613mg [Erythranthe guttata]EYU34996.1 hypothetical protein MIMGU_mgv1a009613mg [Erythranthe guttata]